MRYFCIRATDMLSTFTLSQLKSRLIAEHNCASFTHPVSSSNLAFDDSVLMSIGCNQASSNLFSIEDVAREFDIAHSVVSRLWKSFKTTGMCSRRHGVGRVRSTTPAGDRYIVILAKRNMRTTAQQVANQFLAASGKQISRKTVARRLRGEEELYARRPVVCVPLTRQHRTARLQWCREHHNWTEQDWTCVLFSDEVGSVCHRIVDAN
ncbi:HTH_Tnp_Tc3_2 domain-containing protein [Trichonephila clavipes]|nr:HTH_Tnp_Tc3_2 domain-containing protein [Trichonephila clavipes]